MKAATSLVTGVRPAPELAEEAVDNALDKAGLDRASQVLLFLSHDFARQPQPAVIAAARAAGCLSVAGCTANGLFTEGGWQLDQSAAAALVIASPNDSAVPEAPLLSFSSHTRLPFDWQADGPRAGFLDSDGAAWAHGRATDSGNAELRLSGGSVALALANGLRPLGENIENQTCPVDNPTLKSAFEISLLAWRQFVIEDN